MIFWLNKNEAVGVVGGGGRRARGWAGPGTIWRKGPWTMGARREVLATTWTIWFEREMESAVAAPDSRMEERMRVAPGGGEKKEEGGAQMSLS